MTSLSSYQPFEDRPNFKIVQLIIKRQALAIEDEKLRQGLAQKATDTQLPTGSSHRLDATS